MTVDSVTREYVGDDVLLAEEVLDVIGEFQDVAEVSCLPRKN